MNFSVSCYPHNYIYIVKLMNNVLLHTSTGGARSRLESVACFLGAWYFSSASNICSDYFCNSVGLIGVTFT